MILSGYKRTPKDTIQAGAGAATPFKCGAPLEVKVMSARDNRNSGSPRRNRIVSGLGFREAPVPNRLLQSSSRLPSLGTGGETYSSFFLKGDKGKLRQPPKPAFAIATADGKQVASGNMEFG